MICTDGPLTSSQSPPLHWITAVVRLKEKPVAACLVTIIVHWAVPSWVAEAIPYIGKSRATGKRCYPMGKRYYLIGKVPNPTGKRRHPKGQRCYVMGEYPCPIGKHPHKVGN